MARYITPRTPRIGSIKGVATTDDSGIDSLIAGQVEHNQGFARGNPTGKSVTHKGGNPFAGIVGMVDRGIDKLTTPDTSAIDAQIAQRKSTNQTLQNNRTMRKYGI